MKQRTLFLLRLCLIICVTAWVGLRIGQNLAEVEQDTLMNTAAARYVKKHVSLVSNGVASHRDCWAKPGRFPVRLHLICVPSDNTNQIYDIDIYWPAIIFPPKRRRVDKLST